MATETKPAAAATATETKLSAPTTEEAVKIDLFEDDNEFDIGQEWIDEEEGNEIIQQWEDDWDDDDVNDDFSLQLRKGAGKKLGEQELNVIYIFY